MLLFSCEVCQSHQFGSSIYLQSNDYQAGAPYPDFATTYIKTSASLTLPIRATYLYVLSSTQRTQFRVLFTPATFTNNAGIAGV